MHHFPTPTINIMAAQSNRLEPQYWRAKDLRALGLKIDPALILHATEDFWDAQKYSMTNSLKAYLPISRETVWSDPVYAPHEEKYRNTSLDLRVGSLNAIVGHVCGAKFLHSNPVNIDNGLPRQHSDIIVKHVTSGETLGIVEGTEISNARTALYATRTFDLFFHDKSDVNVFIFGAGEVSRQVVLFLNYHAGSKVKNVIVCSPRSSGVFVEKLKAETTMRFNLQATNDKSQLSKSDFVITVTSNNKTSPPLIATKAELAPGVVTLSLGTNELPRDYLKHVLENGIVACDDIANVNNRGAQALAMYFAESNTNLLENAETYGVKELAAMEPVRKDPSTSVHVACSGLAAIDILCAAAVLLAVAHLQNKTFPLETR